MVLCFLLVQSEYPNLDVQEWMQDGSPTAVEILDLKGYFLSEDTSTQVYSIVRLQDVWMCSNVVQDT